MRIKIFILIILSSFINITEAQVNEPVVKKIKNKKGIFFSLKDNILSNSINNNLLIDVLNFDLDGDYLIVRKKDGKYDLCDSIFQCKMKNFNSLSSLNKVRSLMKGDEVKSNKLQKKEHEKAIDKLAVIKAKEESRERLIRLLGNVLENGKFDYQIIQESEKFNIEKVDYGLVCVFSGWSGHTRIVGEKILNGISKKTKKKIPLILLDSDFIDSEIQKKIVDAIMWKYLASCWVENGEVQKKYKFEKELEPFIEFTKKRLLEIEKLDD